jgi:hypothetical protein
VRAVGLNSISGTNCPEKHLRRYGQLSTSTTARNFLAIPSPEKDDRAAVLDSDDFECPVVVLTFSTDVVHQKRAVVKAKPVA